jgi:2-polyprenyl-6-hydroxyphenyl methylase/3-demethylubiquinone-9 3-methyltransferase
MKPNSTPSATDDHLSFAAREFVWNTADSVAAHDDIGPATIRILQRASARNILDLGCGNGALTGRLQAEGFEITGCDMSVSGIAVARQRFPNIQFFQHDLSQALPTEHVGQYDAVISIEVIEHLLLPRILITNALTALRPGGLLVLTTPFHGYWKNLALAIADKCDDHWHPLRDFGHVKFFSKRTLCTLLREQGLNAEQFLTVGRVPCLARTMIVVARKPE